MTNVHASEKTARKSVSASEACRSVRSPMILEARAWASSVVVERTSASSAARDRRGEEGVGDAIVVEPSIGLRDVGVAKSVEHMRKEEEGRKGLRDSGLVNDALERFRQCSHSPGGPE